MSEQEAYLEQYTSELQPLLLQLAQQEGFLRGPLLETADLDELWPALAQPLYGPVPYPTSSSTHWCRSAG